jgi:hypothetical protein
MSEPQQDTSQEIAFKSIEAVQQSTLEFAKYSLESGGTDIPLSGRIAGKVGSSLLTVADATIAYNDAPEGKEWTAAAVSLGANVVGGGFGDMLGAGIAGGIAGAGPAPGLTKIAGFVIGFGVGAFVSGKLNNQGNELFVHNQDTGEMDWGQDFHVRLNADDSLTFRLNGGAQMTVRYDNDGNVTQSVSKAPSGDSVELQQDGTIIARNAVGNIVASGLVSDPDIDPVLSAHLDAMSNSMDQFFVNQGIPLTTDQLTQNLSSPNENILTNQSGDASAIMHGDIRYSINSKTGAKTIAGDDIIVTKYPDGSASYTYVDPLNGKMISLAQGSDGHCKLYYTDQPAYLM